MTNITLFMKNSHYCGYQFSGHANYKKRNRDIVCAAVSILSQSCTNTLEGILELKIVCKEDETNGFLRVELPEDLDEETLEKTDLVITQMRVGLDGLMDGYPKHVKVRTKEVLK